MGQLVMPFELSKTLHIFEMTESGGILQVVIRDPADLDQVPMIQQHLRPEAMSFSNGDYSDPTSLHGADMPGVKELAEGAARDLYFAPAVVTLSSWPARHSNI